MKVFELMAHLAEMPAGAEVRMRSLKTVREFADFAEEEDGLHRIDLSIEDVTQTNEDLVILYD